MIRGTTPTIRFDLPIDVELVDCMYLTLAQNGKTVIERCLTECSCDVRRVSCKLTQSETLALMAATETQMQVRLRTKGGDALASQITTVRVDRILKDGEI